MHRSGLFALNKRDLPGYKHILTGKQSLQFKKKIPHSLNVIPSASRHLSWRFFRFSANIKENRKERGIERTKKVPIWILLLPLKPDRRESPPRLERTLEKLKEVLQNISSAGIRSFAHNHESFTQKSALEVQFYWFNGLQVNCQCRNTLLDIENMDFVPLYFIVSFKENFS